MCRYKAAGTDELALKVRSHGMLTSDFRLQTSSLIKVLGSLRPAASGRCGLQEDLLASFPPLIVLDDFGGKSFVGLGFIEILLS